MSKLRDEVPQEFFLEFMDTRASRKLDVEVVAEMDSFHVRWPGREKNVHMWWKLADGSAVGWNESPCRGWSFPVVKIKG